MAFNSVKERLMITPLLVLPNVTCLQKGNKMHMQIAKGIVLFQEDIPMAIQVAICKTKGRIHGIYNKNLPAVIHAIDSRMHYLLGMDYQRTKYRVNEVS